MRIDLKVFLWLQLKHKLVKDLPHCASHDYHTRPKTPQCKHFTISLIEPCLFKYYSSDQFHLNASLSNKYVFIWNLLTVGPIRYYVPGVVESPYTLLVSTTVHSYTEAIKYSHGLQTHSTNSTSAVVGSDIRNLICSSKTIPRV